MESVNIFRGRVVDFNIDALTVEVTGESDKLDAFIKFVSQFGDLEMCRAGALAVKRGAGNDNKEEE